MIEAKPGNTVKFTLTFTGVVIKSRGDFIDVRTKRGIQTITRGQVAEVVDPTPPEDRVVSIISCPSCLSVAGQQCRHKQKSERQLKHPHQERIMAWIQLTGWTPEGALHG